MAQAEAAAPRLTDRTGLPLAASLALNFRAISLLEGVRAAIAVAGTMTVGSLLGLPEFGFAALGALLACFTDPGGALRSRLPPMLVFGVLGGACISGFGLLIAHGAVGAVLAAGLAIFCCSLARIYGQAGLLTGNLLAITIVLSLDLPERSLAAALRPGVAFWCGAAGAAALTLALWRFRPFGPARAALADISLGLAALARDLSGRAAGDEMSETRFDLHARGHRRVVREAIERARAVIHATIRQRGAASLRANALALRLATLDQLFGTLIALSEAMAVIRTADPALRRALDDIADLLEAIAPDIEADRSLETGPIRALLAGLKARIATVTGVPSLRRALEAAFDRLSVIVTVSNPPGPAAADAAARPGWREAVLEPLRANLTLGSVPFRHALRTALVTTPVLGFVVWLGNPFGHWLAITVIVVLQPHFSATWVRAIERVGGTVAGGVIAAAIGLVCQSRLELAVAMVPLTLFAFAIRGVNYSVWVIVLTPMVVLLVEQIEPGMGQWTIAISRVGFTVAGGLLAVAANLALWPSFEGNRLVAARLAAIAAHRAYLAASFAYLLDGGSSPEAARRQAGLASNNLEASIARVLMEPHRSDDPLLRAALVSDAALRRTAGRLAILNLEPSPTSERELWRAWAAALDAGFDSDAPEMPSLPPAVGQLGAADSLARVARQAEVIRDSFRPEPIS